MPTRRTDRPRSQRGFTLVELLVVIVVIGLLALWGVPTLLSTLSRTRLVGASREIATMMQVARLEAIKKGGINGDLQNRVTAIRYNQNLRSFDVLLDDDATDATFDPRTPILGRYTLPTGVNLQAPGEAVQGAGAIDAWDVPVGGPDTFDGPIFVSDGSVRVAGAYRIADTRGNFLEVRIDFPATGKIVIQKYFPAASDWFENGEAGNQWEW